MPRKVAEDGINTIVAAPHVSDILHSYVKLRTLVSRLNDYLQTKTIPGKVLLGAIISWL